MSIEAKTGKPGRPPKHNSSIGMKKGKPVWQPASVLDVVGKEEGFRYRWANKAPDNLAKKRQEGWETVSGLSNDQASHVDSGRMHDGKQLTSIYEKHDVVLMRIPEELAESRDEFINQKTQRQTQGLTAHLKKEIRDKGGNAPVHGEITISSLRGTETIE